METVEIVLMYLETVEIVLKACGNCGNTSKLCGNCENSTKVSQQYSGFGWKRLILRQNTYYDYWGRI